MTVAGTAARAFGRPRALVARRPLVSFFVLAYGLSWVAWLPYLLSANALGVLPIRFPRGFPVEGLLGIGPGAFLGPAGAALLVTALAEGRAGVRVWCRRLVRARVAPRWYALALLGYPALVLLALVGMTAAGPGDLHAPSATAVALFVPGLVLQALTSGLAEEPGWRDFAQPRMQDRLGPLPGLLVLGLLWGGWHLPLFFTEWAPAGPHLVPVLGFVLGAVAFSVVIGWAFEGSGRSLPISVLIHGGSNNVITMLAPSMAPGMRAHVGFLSPQLLAAATLATVLVLVTRGRLGRRPRPDEGQSSWPNGSRPAPGNQDRPGTPQPWSRTARFAARLFRPTSRSR